MRIILWVLLGLGKCWASDVADAAEQAEWSAMNLKGDVNAAQADGTTALHWAAYHDALPAVQSLLKAGAKAEVKNRYGMTPLLLACENGNGDIVNALLAAGADANSEREGDEKALMVASRTGKLAAVKALLEHGARVADDDEEDQTAMIWAAAAGHAGVISLLASYGADVKYRLKSGFTPLLFASREGKRDAVKQLLKLGVDPWDAIETQESPGERGAQHGTSAVLLAVENGHFQLAMELIQAGADPNDIRSGFSALHVLTWVRRPPHGDDVSGQPPPDTHGSLSSLDFVRAMAKAGANLNLPLPKGVGGRGSERFEMHGATPFLLACRTADLEMMKLLVELGADPHLKNQEGSTALMAAAGLGCHAPDEEAGTEAECLAACEYLLSLKIDPNAVDDDRETAMHGAAYKSLPAVAKLLTANGAKIEIWNQKNDRGWTPLLIAQGYRFGNFKPSVPTANAISELMLAQGVTPPPAPERESLPKKRGYEQR
jgi:uncharacterized protein